MLARLRRTGPGRHAGLGLILLALWLQALAPAARLQFEAMRDAQGFAGAILCGHDPDAPDTAAGQPAPGHGACHACPFCRVSAAPPVPAAPAPIARRLAWHAAAWPIPPPPHPARPPASERLARAPPAV